MYVSQPMSQSVHNENHLQWLYWWLAEALLAIPGQIVQGDKSPIRNEHHVQISVPNNDIICGFDNFHQWTTVVPRWKRLVVSMNEDLKTWTRQSAYILNTAVYS